MNLLEPAGPPRKTRHAATLMAIVTTKTHAQVTRVYLENVLLRQLSLVAVRNAVIQSCSLIP